MANRTARGPENLPDWLEHYGDRLFRLCTLYLKDLYLAEDAVQDTMLRAYRSWPAFRGESSEETWLTRIAVNVCKSYLRSPWRRKRAPMEELAGLAAPDNMDIPDDTLPHAIMALSRKYREVVLLYYYQEMKVGEIAALLGLSVSTVTARLSRARAKLRKELKEWYYDEI